MVTPQTQRKMDVRKQAQYQTRCIQVNLQHSRAATGNLIQIISVERIGIALIQEPYLYQNRPLGITRGYKTCTFGEGKSRAATVIPDNTMDVLITQLSDDAVLLEIDIEHYFSCS